MTMDEEHNPVPPIQDLNRLFAYSSLKYRGICAFTVNSTVASQYRREVVLWLSGGCSTTGAWLYYRRDRSPEKIGPMIGTVGI
jgi:hypothetical protein